MTRTTLRTTLLATAMPAVAVVLLLHSATPVGPSTVRPGVDGDGVPTDRDDVFATAPDQGDIEAAVDRGLSFLRRTQDPASGAWIQDVGYKRGSDYAVTGSQKRHVGVSALALMAFLSGGHVPGRGDQTKVVERGTDYVIRCVDPDSGFICENDTRMYSHAFATLFLAEIYGMTHREDVKEKLQLSIDLIVKSQNEKGSWRYRPFSPEADMSITVCQIMALRAARDVGIRVPKTTVNRAYDYVDRSAVKNRGSPQYGAFRYKLTDFGSRHSFPLTAAGIATCNHSGVYDNELVRAGISFLRRELVTFSRQHRGDYFYWYGHYYASQVFFLSNRDDDEELWTSYWQFISRDLLSFQDADGSWPNDTGPGRAFATAVACVILQIPTQYLPIFHR